MKARLPSVMQVALVAAALLVHSVTGGVALAQAPGGEALGFAEVPVRDGDVPAARQAAVRAGQREAIWKAVRGYLHPAWAELYEDEIRQEIAGARESFIQSYRTAQVRLTPDDTVVQAAVAIQVSQPRVVALLEGLQLPVQGQPKRPVSVVYAEDDPVLGGQGLRLAVRDALAERLGALNLTLVETVSLFPDQATVLADEAAGPQRRLDVLETLRTRLTVYLAFDARQAGVVGGRIRFFRNDTGEAVAGFSHTPAAAVQLPGGAPEALPPALAQQVVQPLLQELQPRPLQALYAIPRQTEALVLRVAGLGSVEDVEAFERILFQRDSPFAQLSVDRLTRRAVTYRGSYQGDQSGLALALDGRQIGGFQVQQADWEGEVLVLDVARVEPPPHPDPRPFPSRERPLDVQQALESYYERYPGMEGFDPQVAEVEDNGWISRANPLALRHTVYGEVDSRVDSDVYLLEGLQSGTTYELSWFRVGRTNLTPAVRLYGADGLPQRVFYPNARLNTTVTVPEGAERFYVEVADRFGFIPGESGGYLRYAYLLRVRQVR